LKFANFDFIGRNIKQSARKGGRFIGFGANGGSGNGSRNREYDASSNTWSDKGHYKDGTDDYSLEKYPVGNDFLVLPSLGVKVEGTVESVHLCGRSLRDGCCCPIGINHEVLVRSVVSDFFYHEAV